MSSDKVKKELKELLKDPVNKYCADCPIKGPTWASVNIGVWMCMPCSGIHRSLGTHITQVRSVDLDKWKPEWVDVMRQWGNTKANAVWEAKMPRDYDGKPNETEAQELSQKLQKFIRDKYERKKWYSESAAKKQLGKKEASSSAEEESSEEFESESEEEVKPKKKSTSKDATSTAKKPIILMKQQTGASSKPVVATKKPVVDEPDSLLDTFDPFGDSSGFSAFASSSVPAAPATAASTAQNLNPFGDGMDDFVSAAPVQASAAPASASSTPLFDLNSLYGMSQPQQPQPAGWTLPTTPSSFPGVPGQSQQPAAVFPGVPTQNPQPTSAFPGFPPQQNTGGQVMIGGYSFPAPPLIPQQQQQPQPGGNSFPFGQMSSFPAQQPSFGGHQPQTQSQMWPTTALPSSTQQQPPQKQSGNVNTDPFSGLLF